MTLELRLTAKGGKTYVIAVPEGYSIEASTRGTRTPMLATPIGSFLLEQVESVELAEAA
jgi:hypothetical protein